MAMRVHSARASHGCDGGSINEYGAKGGEPGGGRGFETGTLLARTYASVIARYSWRWRCSGASNTYGL